MYIYIHIYVHTCTHTHTHVRGGMCIHKDSHTHAQYACINIHDTDVDVGTGRDIQSTACARINPHTRTHTYFSRPHLKNLRCTNQGGRGTAFGTSSRGAALSGYVAHRLTATARIATGPQGTWLSLLEGSTRLSACLLCRTLRCTTGDVPIHEEP